MSIQFGATCFFNTPSEFPMVVEVAKKYPFVKYVEFRGEHPFLFPDVTPKKDIQNYKNFIKNAGLKSTLHTSMYDVNMATLNPWLKEANIACYKKYLDLAAYLESEIIVVHGGKLQMEFAKSSMKQDFIELAENHLCESLVQLAEYGKKKGVKVALENSPPSPESVKIVHDPESHIKIIQRINHPNLGALLDLAHAYLFRLDIADYLREIKPYLFEIHAHNNFGKEDEHWGLPKGNMDYQSILKQNEIHDVPFIMEIESYEEVITTLEWLTGMGFNS